MLLLLSVTQPGHGTAFPLTPVGFAALAHTRCAFIASGELPSNIWCGMVEAGKYIRNLASEDKTCQALFLATLFEIGVLAGSCYVKLARTSVVKGRSRP